MKNVMIAFEEYYGNPDVLVVYNLITGHLVFDINLGENFRQKAISCAAGHNTGALVIISNLQ